ncbi:enoyl-CoA hydratase-related protein [Gynuella sunshinyii]|uniref:Enoyl-CoA hydratase n=1 Tax=Gynuella sunshinyii YC6258 TaxID=1445510 RepID=A0A0C5VM56_9GAMM|nr:enoyl-CoA hydratase-related protein [Gynuella sunshinyii]AJQ95782.1 enoyl-CoA hydratase/carnithine racemase [Gynuella sunshinyii YC6258]DAC80055.1 TPA_exp: enoyl-CoA hydratase [Gynuella sunshinyii YC6258]
METVQTNIDARGVATLTINRPERANAYNDEVIYSLVTALDDFSNHPDIRLVYLKSTGQTYSAGADLTWMGKVVNSGGQSNRSDCQQTARLFSTIYNFPLPILTTIQGPVYGGGVAMVACCDIVLAATEAEFFLNDVKYGLAPAVASPYLIKALGEKRAKYYCLTTRPFTAPKALSYGLVHEVLPADHLDSAAEQIITDLCTFSPTALRQTKAMLQYSACEPFDDDLIDVTVECFAELRNGPDFQESLNTFAERKHLHHG